MANKGPFRAVFTDLDGTLLAKDQATITLRTADAVRQARLRGVEIIPATGRGRGMLPPSVLGLPMRYALVSNGAAVLRLPGMEMLATDFLSLPLALELVEWAERHGVVAQVTIGAHAFLDGRLYDSGMRRSPSPPPGVVDVLGAARRIVPSLPRMLREKPGEVEKIVFIYMTPENKQKALQELATLPDYTACSSMPDNLEFNAAGCDKARGAQLLCDILGISPEEVIAIGDGYNDHSLLRWAGHSVAMGNAAEDTKALADKVTDTNIGEGVAQVLERLLLETAVR